MAFNRAVSPRPKGTFSQAGRGGAGQVAKASDPHSARSLELGTASCGLCLAQPFQLRPSISRGQAGITSHYLIKPEAGPPRWGQGRIPEGPVQALPRPDRSLGPPCPSGLMEPRGQKGRVPG